MSAGMNGEGAQANTDATATKTAAEAFYPDPKPAGETPPPAEVAGEGGDGGEKKVEGEGASGAPEAYEAFKLPEGVEADSEVMGEFTEFAKALGLPQDKAQGAVDLGMKLAQKTAEQVAATQQKAWADQREAWVGELKADKEFGGAKFGETAIRANRALERFADPATVEYLRESGLGDCAGLVKMLARMDAAMGEDKAVDGSGATSGAKHAKDVWYS